MHRTCSRILVLLIVALVARASAVASAPRPRVVILATGGTIAGAQTRPGGAGYQAGVFSVDALLRSVPGLDGLAIISGEQIANIGSQDMNDAVWLQLARRVNELQTRADVDGIVITHGTDTMEETAYFLHLVTIGEKPVVLVGAMRPATALSADGPMNLYNAVAVATHPGARGRGVLVVMNDLIHGARDVTKTNTTSLQTFASPNRGPAGTALFGQVRFHGPAVPRPRGLAGTLPEKLPHVSIVYAHANVGREQVDAAVAAGARGIVLAGVGEGNASREMTEALAAAASHGIVVIRSSRVGSGMVAPTADDRPGFVSALDLNPQKARVLLQQALLHTSDPAAIQRYFEDACTDPARDTRG